MTSRELVYATLEFRNNTGKIPRQMWVLPWANYFQPDELKRITNAFDWDIVTAPAVLSEKTIEAGDPYEEGAYTDVWGAKFHNIHRGVIGEVKDALVKDDDWADSDNIHIPTELLTFDAEVVNNYCKNTDKFVLSGCCPRPFEQLQFIRGTENLYMDLVDPPQKMLDFIKEMHKFYCKWIEKWAKTGIDAINMMDDWGSQNTLLINPKTWVELFKPLYKDYVDIAHSHGKKIFMHSDGNTKLIIPHLIEIGLDAFNTQIFCIGIENLAEFKGQLTFWGEIDRQHLIPRGTFEEIHAGIDLAYDTLWANGGVIAQCEYGAGANPNNIYEIYKHWETKGK